MANVQKIRKRTIGYQPRPAWWDKMRVVPSLMLAGCWMEQAGFETGNRVEIEVQQGKIIITNG
jgi:hypothetical protein